MKKFYSIFFICMSLLSLGQAEDLDRFQRVEGFLYDITYTEGSQYIQSTFSGGERRIFASGAVNFSSTVDFLARRVVYQSDYFYLLGTFSGIVDFDLASASTSNLAAVSGTDYFIAKYSYSNDPQLQWVRRYDNLELYDLVLDASDHLHLIGGFSGTVDANPGAGTSNLTSTNESYAIVELDNGGSYISAFSFGENNSLDISTSGRPHFDVDNSGNYYIGGTFDSGTITFDGSNSITEQHTGGVFEGFIAKFNNSGIFQWVDHQPSSNSSLSVNISDVEIEGSTILYSGTFSADVDFSGLGSVSSSATANTFIARINSSGSHTGVYEVENSASSGSFMKGNSKLEIDKFGNYWILSDGGSGLSLRLARLSSNGTVEFYGNTGTSGAQSFQLTINDRILIGQSAIEGSTQYYRLHHFAGYCFTDPVITSIEGTPRVGSERTTSLTIDGELNSAANWEWFTGSCSGTSIATGETLSVSGANAITETTTFYAKAMNSGCAEVCQSIEVQYDNVAPTVTQYLPVPGATGVSISTSGTASDLSLTFSEDITLNTTTGNIELFNESGTRIQEFTTSTATIISGGSNMVNLNVLQNLDYQTTYYVRFAPDFFQDIYGNNYAGIIDNTTWSFTTEADLSDNTPPIITSLSPADNASDVSLDQTFSATFNEPIVLESGQVIINMFKDGSIFSQFSEGNTNVSSSNNTLTFTLPGLTNDGSFSIQLLNIQDAAGNEIAATNQSDWSFTTASLAPSVTSFSPVNGANDVLPRIGELVMNMSEDVVAGTGALRLRVVGANTTVKIFQMGTADVEINGSTVTLKNVPLLGYGSSYWVQNFNFNDDAISDVDGNTLEHWNTDATWSFTVREMIEWNGSSWIGGIPPGESDGARIRGNYNTSTDGALHVTDLSVSGGGPLVAFVANGNTVTEISQNLSVIGSGSVMVESGASLIILGEHSGNDITAKRNVTGNAGLSMVGSPIQNMNIGNQGADYSFKFNANTQAWETVASEIIQPGEGYFVGYNETSPSVEFTGAPHAGEVIVPIPADGYKLIANPYLGPIGSDGISFAAAPGVTDGNIWLWDDGGANANGNRVGGYITINQAGTTQATNGASGNTFEGFFPSFQAFFVRGDTDGGDFVFTPSMMTSSENANSDNQHFRKNELEKIKLSLGNDVFYNELIVAFSEAATFGEDHGLDARKLEGADGFSFSSLNKGQLYAIQTLPKPTESFLVPLQTKVPTANSYEISVKEMIRMDRFTVELLNHATGEKIRLNEDFSGTININSSTQYSLIFSLSGVLSTTDRPGNLVFTAGHMLHIRQEADVQRTYEVYNLKGQLELTTETKGNQTIDVSHLATGIYLVFDGQQTHKIILK